jgi:steroid 5-alpha reductase family enzyme
MLFIYYSFTWSIIGNNCSKVDQIWSITPVVFAWLFYLLDGTNNVRVFTIAVLVTLWGSRLTFNFWRRGGYGNLIHHEEDYRWPILRQQINNPVLFYIFNLTFIASYQNLLLWFICLPIYVVSKQSQRSLTSGDVLVSVLFIALLIFETLSDQQQWNFQNFKYSFSAEQRAKHASKDVRDGFLTKGLFTYTRHPNYFCEQSIWVAVYLFSVTSSDGQWLNWSVLGVIQLIALFAGSM